MDPYFEQHLIGQLRNFGYLIGDPATKTAAVIDPSFDARILQRAAANNGYAIEIIFNTHHHPDHVFDNERLADETGAKVAAHRLSLVRKDITLEDGQIVPVGGLKVKVVHTPGHSPGSVSFWWDGLLWVGDVLFAGSIGRTDLPGGSFETLAASIRGRLFPLGDDMRVLPGHGPETTIGIERRTNPFVGEGVTIA